MTITAEQAAVAKGLLARGDKQHDIAAYFGVNGGRIAEIAKRQRWPNVLPASPRSLPAPKALRIGERAYHARLALLRARRGIDAALAVLDAQEADPDIS